MAHATPRKYRPLAEHLAALPPDTAAATVTFAEIEALIGAPLPPSAWTRQFWHNARQSWGVSAQTRAWQGAGWRVATVTRGRVWSVTFVRADSTYRRSA